MAFVLDFVPVEESRAVPQSAYLQLPCPALDFDRVLQDGQFITRQRTCGHNPRIPQQLYPRVAKGMCGNSDSQGHDGRRSVREGDIERLRHTRLQQFPVPLLPRRNIPWRDVQWCPLQFVVFACRVGHVYCGVANQGPVDRL